MLSRFNTATSSSIFSGGLTPQGSFATDDWSLTFVSDDGQAILESSASLEGQARGGMDSASLTAQMESMAGVSFACGILERAMPHIHNDEVRAATATAAYSKEAVLLTHEEGRSTSSVRN